MEVDDVQLLADVPGRQDLLLQLSSLLEIDFDLARKALDHCQWNYEAAVDAACQLASSSSSSSSQPAQQSRNRSAAWSSSRPGLPSETARSSRGQPSSSSSQSLVSSSQDAVASGPAATPATLGQKRSFDLDQDAPDVFVSRDPSSKKQRMAPPTVFRIPNNNGDAPAANPPLFQEHPLREEQLRSLGWMVSQEKCTQTLVKGGLLADRMGYGKTSTTIGLISLDVDTPLRKPTQRSARRLEDGSYVPSDTTLILCPSHLVDQWEREFWKFLGNAHVQIWKVQDYDYPLKNSRSFEVTYKLKGLSRRASMGIKVKQAPSCWGKLSTSLIVTDIDHSKRRLFLAEAGPHEEIRCGDMITQITINRLTASNGKIIPSLVRKGSSQISSFLEGCGPLSLNTRIQDGYEQVNGVQRPRYRYVDLELKANIESTVTFTISRLASEMPRTRLDRGQGQMKVLTIRKVADLQMLQQNDFASKFHVIIAPVGIFAETKYAEIIKSAAGASGRLMEHVLSDLRSRMKEWCEENFANLVLQRSPPLFELIFWRRVIFDEFHESEAWEYRVREMLKCVGATYKWGLSGTPPLADAVAVAELAGLLGHSKPSEDGDLFAKANYYSKSTNRSKKKAIEFFALSDVQAALSSTADGFVRKYIRQNTSALIENIAVVEHDELVEHSSEERLIYRQACHDQGIFNLAGGYDGISMEARAVLLKRCAHFDLGEAAESAASAVSRLGDSKRERVVKVQQQIWIEVGRAMCFGIWDQKGKDSMRASVVNHSEAKAFIDYVLSSSEDDVESKLAEIEMVSDTPASTNTGKFGRSLQVTVKMLQQDGELRLRPEVRLIQPIKENEYYIDDRQRHAVVHAVAKRARNREADAVLSDRAICQGSCRNRLEASLCIGLSELVTQLDKAHRSLQFYTQQLNSLTTHEGDEEIECSICLESASDIQTMAILPCSHVFHVACIREVLASNPCCPECRTPVQVSHVSSVVMELKPPEPKPDRACQASKGMSAAWKQNGSKLNAVAKRLREIRRLDPTAKALVFVQWADLEVKVWRALHDHGVPFLKLAGDKRAKSELCGGDAAVLRNFQEDTSPDAPFVLVMSLQRAAAGTNLTAASHVLFVHPMNAEEVRTAAAYERQALARVRRIGQTKNQVHLWRFVTKQTVEEHIWKLHRDAPADVEADASGTAPGGS
eukprot:TRINITY_DN5220_c2_g3_i2.p1 TRINITY_DN5220_c2_g3~~TRINITY_DN5220_c2_g3_i2.p1  ORF type:complete len:1184 (-),score=141.99 TRINITY_DN5220_c2_g3_i2:148-3699(-)